MIFHENCLQADNSHEISCLIYFWNSGNIWNCCLLQIVGGALYVKTSKLGLGMNKNWTDLCKFLEKQCNWNHKIYFIWPKLTPSSKAHLLLISSSFDLNVTSRSLMTFSRTFIASSASPYGRKLTRPWCLFDLILYVPSTIFQLYRDRSCWVEPVLS